MNPHVLHNIIHQEYGNSSAMCPVCSGSCKMTDTKKLEELAGAILERKQRFGMMYSEKKTGITVKSQDKVLLQTAFKFDENATELPKEIMLVPLGAWDTTKYGPVKVTADDIQTMKSNFDNQVRKGVMIDIDHGSSQYGDAAAGWIKEVECRTDGLWATEIEWTPLGEEQVKGKMYKFLSPEFDIVYVDPQDRTNIKDNVLIATSLVNRPLLKEIPALTFSEGQNLTSNQNGVMLFIIESDNGTNNKQEGPKTMLTFSEVLKKITAGETLNEQEIAVAKENESQLTDDQKKSLGFKVEAGEAPKDDNISNKQGQVTISASELAELRAGAEAGRKALEAREQESFKSEISSLKFSDKGGSLPLGMVDEFVSFGMKLSPALRVEFSELLKKMPETKLFGEIGSDGEQSVSNSADNRMALRNEIASYAKEHNMKFGEALRTLQSQDPDKFAQYKKSFTE